MKPNEIELGTQNIFQFKFRMIKNYIGICSYYHY